jgi:Transposase DDE domain
MAGAFSSALKCTQIGSIDFRPLSSPDQAEASPSSPGRASRVRELPPWRTLELYVQQVAHGNVACDAVRHLAGSDFSGSGWCQARTRLNAEAIDTANQRVIDLAMCELAGDAAKVAPLWHGHRVLILDGTNDLMPDTPALRAHYGVPPRARPGLGDPTSHLLLCMDHRTGLITDCIDGPCRRSDLADTPQVHARLHKDDIVLGDRYFSNYAHIALILQTQGHVVMPVHHMRIVDFSPDREHVDPHNIQRNRDKGKPRTRLIKKLGTDDQIVEYFKPKRKPDWLTEEQWESIPESIQLRECRRTIHRKGFRPIVVTIVTSLLDADEYPAEELVELRLTRWKIETNIRHLKITLGMEMLKCKTLAGVRKERKIFILVYNLIHLQMIRAAKQQGVNVHRISFAGTLAWLRLAEKGESDDQRIPTMKVNPIRPGRREPRLLKRSPAKYPCMTKSRAQHKAQLQALQVHTA